MMRVQWNMLFGSCVQKDPQNEGPPKLSLSSSFVFGLICCYYRALTCAQTSHRTALADPLTCVLAQSIGEGVRHKYC